MPVKYLCLAVLLMWLPSLAHGQSLMYLFDTQRDREIPIEISEPEQSDKCEPSAPCPVAFLSAGYGVPHTDYRFLTGLFSQQGYLVVAIAHELPGDPPLATKGDFLFTRAENWERGAQTLRVVKQQLARLYPAYDFSRLTLIGHSNGGDISSWYSRDKHAQLDALITLDHRRVPLPRTNEFAVMTIRAGDFPADRGVLLNAEEQQQFGSCQIDLKQAKHNDMSDAGPEWLILQIQHVMRVWLDNHRCESPA